MNNSGKIIFHIDLNCFFASCEIAENNTLKNKPVVVAPQDPLYRGIILSPNYEARAYGIKTTMLVKEALSLCRELVVVPPRMALYSEYSKKFFEYLSTITQNIEAASIDEGYLDVTETNHNIHPLDLAAKIQKDLLDMYQLPSSIGIGPNTFLAKMASNYKKPLGITIFRKREIDQYLWLLPIESMHGVGKKTSPRLREIGINTIGDLANFRNISLLQETIGAAACDSLLFHAQGGGRTELELTPSEASSVSNAHTFSHLVYDGELIKKTLRVIANTVSYRLQKANQKAQTIGITIKYGDQRQINRSKAFVKASNDSNEIFSIAEEIFDEYFTVGDQIRLIGIFAHRLTDAEEGVQQISIFDNFSDMEKTTVINDLVKSLQNKFGKDNINQGYYEFNQKKD